MKATSVQKETKLSQQTKEALMKVAFGKKPKYKIRLKK